MTIAAAAENDLLAVPGAERLRWVGEPLAFTPERRWNSLPVVVATGGADAALVYLARTEQPGEVTREAMLSRTFDGAFASWPPTVGEPVEQLARDFGNFPPQIVAWPDGRFIMTRHGGLLGRWDRATGATDERLWGWPTRDGALYVTTQRDGVSVIEHRGGAALDEVTLVGPSPSPHRNSHAGVTEGGVLWLACVDRSPPRDLPMNLTVDVHRGVPGELRACGSITCPAGFHVREVLGRGGGGAWIVMESGAGMLVQGLDAEGASAGEPWRLPFADVYRGDRALTSWGDGFAVVVCMNPVVLLVSDGVHTTRAQAGPGGAHPVGRHPSLAVAPGGRSLLVAHQTVEGFRVVRADVSAAPPGGDEDDDPWEADRRVLHARAARAAERAANPPPPRLPGHPIESLDDDAPILHARKRFVGQIFLRATLKAITAGEYDEGGGFRGSHEEGVYVEPNGSGDHVAFAWGAEGLVGIAFDHEMNDEAGIDHDLLNPERHFQRVPERLAALVKRAIALANREATGAVWITAGAESRWDETGSGIERLHGYALRAADVLTREEMGHTWPGYFGAIEAQGRLAARLAAGAAKGERQVVTAEDEVVLLAGSVEREDIPPDPRHVGRRAAMLAVLGIDWPDAVEHAQAVAAADPDQGYALIDAVAKGDVEEVRMLLAAGANLQKRSRRGQGGARRSTGGETPLLVAIRMKHVELVTVLLDAGAGASRAADGMPPLVHAAHAGSREIFELLLQRGASFDEVRERILFSAISGRSADIIDLCLDRGAETRMPLGWYDQFVAVARAENRPDLLERFPEPPQVKKARSNLDEMARSEARRFAREALRSVRIRHLVRAFRGIHEEVEGHSTFEGNPAAGRHTWSSGQGREEVWAWNEHGVIAWARDSLPALRVPGGSPPPPTPSDALASAPPQLRVLVDSSTAAYLAPDRATEVVWSFPGAAETSGLRGWGGNSMVFASYGQYGMDARDPRTPGWPREALAVRPELASRAFSMAGNGGHRDYPTVTETDEALMLQPLPGRDEARVRPEGVEAAIAMLRQLGIRWQRPA